MVEGELEGHQTKPEKIPEMEGGASVDGDAGGKGFIKPSSGETLEVWENPKMETVVRIAL